MNYHIALQHLTISGELILPTLGGRSKFKVTTADDLICITNSAGQFFIVQSTIWDSVVMRVNQLNLNDRLVTGNYTAPNWADCPHMILYPYVAKLYIHLVGLPNKKVPL
jgi:hypothetical protein